ncbi:MAG: hypothetical protein WA190_17635 [Usitatibacter sp.]
MDANLRASKFLIAKADGACYKCHALNEFVAIVAPPGHEVLNEDDDKWEAVGESSILGWIRSINPEAAEAVQKISPDWKYSRSRTLEDSVYMNHCRACHAHQGDYFLHAEPDAPFFPDEAKPNKIRLVELLNLPLVVDCGMHSLGGEVAFPEDEKA